MYKKYISFHYNRYVLRATSDKKTSNPFFCNENVNYLNESTNVLALHIY